MNHRKLAERYAATVRKRRILVRMIPWPILVQVILWAIQYFILDARASHASVDEILGPITQGGVYTGDMPGDVVADWRAMGRA